MRPASGKRSTRERPGTFARRLGWTLRVLGFGAGALAIASYLLLYVVPLPAPPRAVLQNESTKIYDRDGRLLYDSAGPADAHYTFMPLDQLPAHLRNAVIATEDADFYEHTGVDPVAVARAMADNALHLEMRSGASTITQQLARNLYFGADERASSHPMRKLREGYLALRMERAYTKNELLELYLNRVYFGNLAYGVEAASQTYFARSARDLDLAESAFLAGLLQGPSLYDPFTRFEHARARQRIVLGLMAESGYISAHEAAAAFEEPLQLSDTPFPIEAPHFVAWVQELLPDLIGEESLAAGDLRIHTTLDLSLQSAAQAAVQRQVAALERQNVTSAAVVALDAATGDVLAMVGSADYFDAARAGNVNGALALRQPGSAVKPVVYAAALEQGMSPATPLMDVPTSFATRTGEVYTPNNYDLTFHGIVPLREALASSYNVPAVRLLQTVGIEPAFRLGQSLGLTSFQDVRDYDLSLTLGGGEVRLLDLTAAYGAFANGGLRVVPNAISRIETADGAVIYQAPRHETQRVLSAESAYLLSDILSDNTARAPGFGLNSPLNLGRTTAAVKTGTTSDFRDNWTVGYTPNVVVGVWAGNPDGSAMRDVSGVTGAAPIWRDVMHAALQNQPAAPFLRPEGIQQVEVCLPSGLLPTADCQRRRTELFAKSTAPTERDAYYRRLPGCETVTNVSAGCDGRVYAFVPVEAIPWAREAGLDLPPVAPYLSTALTASRGAADAVAAAPELRLVSPADGLVLSLSREVRAEDQQLTVQGQPSVSVRHVEILVDGAVVARLEDAPYRYSWPLREGQHRFEARAVSATGQEFRSASSLILVLPR